MKTLWVACHRQVLNIVSFINAVSDKMFGTRVSIYMQREIEFSFRLRALRIYCESVEK